MITLPAGIRETDGRTYVIDAQGIVICEVAHHHAEEIARALNMQMIKTTIRHCALLVHDMSRGTKSEDRAIAIDEARDLLLDESRQPSRIPLQFNSIKTVLSSNSIETYPGHRETVWFLDEEATGCSICNGTKDYCLKRKAEIESTCQGFLDT